VLAIDLVAFSKALYSSSFKKNTTY